MTRSLPWIRMFGLAALVAAAQGCSPAPAPPSAAQPPPAAAPASAAASVSVSVSVSASVSASAPVSASVSAPAPAPVSASAASPAPFRSDEVFRIAIRGGEVIDGSGAPRRRADVLVRGNRIAFVGDVDPSVKAERTIDAKGSVVTPGFIDAHAHANPMGDVEPSLAMGVTTVVLGQDGVSPAERIGAWLATIDAARPRINVAALVGHGTVRSIAGVRARKAIRPQEVERMRALVDEAMREGAFGLSTGLEYDPGRAAAVAELVAVAEPVGERGGVVMSHLRSEDDDKINASLDELFEQCKRSRARAHIAHLKVVLGRGEARAGELLARIAEARRGGLEVTADIYPYAASYTTVAILFPDFARLPGAFADAKRTRRAEILAHLRARVEKRNGPKATLFGTGEHAGKTLEDVARERGMPFEEVLLDIGPNGAEAAYFVMDEAVVAGLLADPFVMIGTDGGGGGRHPRGYGSFARVLEEFVEKRKTLTLEEAVRKMAGLPARTLGLEGDLGCLRAGCAADFLVFVPSAIRARADWGTPYKLADGMKVVAVGGVIEREGGKPTPGRGGRALRFAGAKGR